MECPPELQCYPCAYQQLDPSAAATAAGAAAVSALFTTPDVPSLYHEFIEYLLYNSHGKYECTRSVPRWLKWQVQSVSVVLDLILKDKIRIQPKVEGIFYS